MFKERRSGLYVARSSDCLTDVIKMTIMASILVRLSSIVFHLTSMAGLSEMRPGVSIRLKPLAYSG